MAVWSRFGEVKPGDLFYVNGRSYGSYSSTSRTVLTVASLTHGGKRIVMEDGSAWRISDGNRWGADAYGRTWIARYTNEVGKSWAEQDREIATKNRIATIRDRVGKLTPGVSTTEEDLDALEAIVAKIEKAREDWVEAERKAYDARSAHRDM